MTDTTTVANLATLTTSAPVNLNDTPATPKARKVRKVKRGVGRPSAEVKLILNKSFTLKDLQALNPSVKPVTIRAHVLRGLETGRFTKLDRTVQTGRKGKPANIFINRSLYEANLRNLAKSKARKAEAVVA